MPFVFASHNAHKVREFGEILHAIVPGVDVVPYDGPEPVESGTTFAHNALIKARAAVAYTGQPAIADDSGLCVDVMGGMPGIFSSRWSGNAASDERNVELLLEQIQDVPDEFRTAHFECVIAVVFPGNSGQAQREFTTLGRWSGRIAREPSGAHGFGYDPVFVPEGHARTAAELDSSEKNSLSHRARAIAELAVIMNRLGDE